MMEWHRLGKDTEEVAVGEARIETGDEDVGRMSELGVPGRGWVGDVLRQFELVQPRDFFDAVHGFV